MIERDFVMRQVRQLANALARVISMRRSGQVDEASRLLSETLARGTNFDLERLRHLSRSQLIDLCRQGDIVSGDLAVSVADLLSEDAELLTDGGGADRASLSAQRAIWLYEAASETGSAMPADLGRRLEMLASFVSDEHL